MTLQNFNKAIQDLDEKGLLFDANHKINNDIIEIFKKNELRLINEFFDAIETDIKNFQFGDISRSLPILIFNPIKSKDYERFNNILFSAADQLETNLNHTDFSSLGWFIWVLLDHKLHDWYMDETDFNIKLKKFKLDLHKFEQFHEEIVQLLYQKIEHF